MFYVVAKRVSLDGYPEQLAVSRNNTVTHSFDETMFFETSEEARKWTESKEAGEWKDCTFDVVDTASL